ncbi:TonB-dependent receptor [Duganella guangzhouensis]|nr:TonB-dependent receptor [Duganella guangzhouensis]
MKNKQFKLTPLAAALACALSLPAYAQTEAAADAPAPADATSPRAERQELTTIVVTAERSAQSLQKTSISMVAISEREIAEQGITNAADALKNITNVEVQGAARGSVIAMRGLGSDLPPGMGESAVSTNFDGIYNFRAEGNTAGLFDLERIEVLRGPQGTLYGRSASGGVVNFLTRNPQIGKSTGNVSLELGTYGLVRTEGGANIPVNDMLAIRISGTSTDRKGYLSDGYNDDVSNAGRIKVLFKPTAGISLLAATERVRLNGKGIGFIPQDNWNDASKRLQAATGAGTDIGYQRYEQNKTWLELNADLGFGLLTVLPAWQRADGELYRKFDASRTAGSEEQSNRDPNHATQDSLEARLASPAGAPFKWVAGYYGYKMHGSTYCLINCDTTSPNPNDTSTRSKAGFAQVTVPLTTGWRGLAGIRTTKDEKTISSLTEGQLKDTWKSTDGKVGLEYDLNSATMAYATYATAYRPGGFNALPAAVQPLRFESEKMKSAELGIKSRLLHNTLQINADIFSLNYENYQVVDFSPPTYSRISNVPKQKVRGVEIDSRMLLGEFGQLRASVALLDAKLGSFVPYGTTTNLEGQQMPHAPRRTFKIGYEYPIDLSNGAAVILKADARRVSEQYVSATENAYTLQEAYSSGDVSAVYRAPDEKWSVTAYMKNVSNYIAKTGNFGGYATVSAPRTSGVILNYSY